jgi:hypothetical protein
MRNTPLTDEGTCGDRALDIGRLERALQRIDDTLLILDGQQQDLAAAYLDMARHEIALELALMQEWSFSSLDQR